MRSKILILILFLITVLAYDAQAFWIWTPETNQWQNPKYSVKETPSQQLSYALEFYEVKDYKQARVEFLKLLKHFPRAREAAEAQYYIAKAQEDQGELFKAFKSYQVVIEKYPFSDRAGDIVEEQFNIGIRLLEGEDERNKIVKTIVGGDYDVVDVFRTVIKNGPYGEFAAPAQYKIGLYLQEKQLYEEARDEFEKVMNDYPDSEWSQAAKYQIALADANRSAGSQYDQGITQSAVEEFKEFVETYPGAELSNKAQEKIGQLRNKEAENNFVIAEFYEKQKNYKAAKIYYSSVVEDFKNTQWAQKALEKIREINEKAQ